MLKKALQQFLKDNLLVFILIIIGLFFHFLYLDIFPVGLTHDDADVVLSMKTLSDSGVDVSGVGFPNLLFFNKTQGNISGLASFLISPIFKLFELDLFSIHFVYVIINIASLILLSYLVYLLSKNEKLSLYIFLIGLFNPWMFAYSRYPTEAPIALLFVLIALVFFFSKLNSGLLLSSVFFILSFYSYYGAKIAIIILFPLLLLIFRPKKYLFSLPVFILGVASYFLVSIFNTNSTLSKRLGNELIFKNIETYQQRTDEFRKISLEQKYKYLFLNKYVFLGEDVFKKYIGWMSPSILFFEGDPVSVYRFSDHGLFYILDAILFIFGFIYFVLYAKENKKLIVLSMLLFIIAPIGSSISNIGTSYFFRSFLLLIPLTILTGSGLYYLQFILEKHNKKIFWYAFIILYTLFFVRFLNFYFVRYLVYSQENNFFSERILSSYIKRVGEIKIISLKIVNEESFINLHKFYNRELRGNIVITNDCSLIDNEGVAIYDSVLSCSNLQKDYLVIVNQKDSGVVYKIFGDSLCSNTVLTPFKREHKLSDYKVESMSDSEFCNRWIQKQ